MLSPACETVEIEKGNEIMKVYAIVCTTDYEGSSAPEGIYADEMRANAVCAVLNKKSPHYESYEVFEYELETE